ncbi:MAG: glutamate 5-kinase [Dehalococcoidia bacterium]|nr:glutamate 5-kinase [Dehalococcoidia bacterium]
MAPKNYRRVVAKFGTNLLTAGSDRLDLRTIATLVGQVARLRRDGVEVVVVTSGAIAAGRHILDRPVESSAIVRRQVYASVGQGMLMRSYSDLFAWHDVIVAQALLTRRDLSDRSAYLNARSTLASLLGLGIVPVVNENDVVAVDEIAEAVIGDNDSLSALVANLIEADLLAILTDSGGLFASDPRTDPATRVIETVTRIEEAAALVQSRRVSRSGTGGMATKIEAARLATASGTDVVIAGGHENEVLLRASRGESVGTFFPSSVSRIEGRKRFLLSGLSARGEIVVDDGASGALLSQGKSLLPAGVREVKGPFQRGDTVIIANGAGRRIGYGITNYDEKDVRAILGRRSTEIESVLGYDYGAEVVHRNNLVLLEGGGV